MTCPSEPTPRGRHAKATRFASGFATLRDAIAFTAGLVVIGHEVFVAPTAEPAVVAVGVALTGLPAVFGGMSR